MLDFFKTDRWFWGVILHYTPLYRHVAVASLLVNLLGLAIPLFVMNVYDRIVPNSAFESLWVLTFGVGLAAVLDRGTPQKLDRYVRDKNTKESIMSKRKTHAPMFKAKVALAALAGEKNFI